MILDFESALSLMATQAATLAPPRETETLPLLETLGRILAAPVTADRDQPPFDRSTRDGFATRAADLNARQPLNVIGTLKAGDLWSGPALLPGQALEIMTGAPIPPGADAVAMLEHVTLINHLLTPEPNRTWHPGENIVPQASEAHAGQTVLPTGTPIAAAEIALAAACGRPTLTVFRRPRVAIVATGDELVELAEHPLSGPKARSIPAWGEVPGTGPEQGQSAEGATYRDRQNNPGPAALAPQQIWNSNSHALAALVLAAGGDPIRLPITLDTRASVAASLALARHADLIVFSGGVSMGQYDLIEEVLQAAHAEFLFTGVRMQPGKPVVFGKLDNQFFFGLPGNPISTQVTFHCFVEPFLRTLAGAAAPQTPRWALATLAHPSERKPNLTRLLPAHLAGTQVRIVGWQGSGDLAANARANCYAELPASQNTQTEIPAGTPIRILLR